MATDPNQMQKLLAMLLQGRGAPGAAGMPDPTGAMQGAGSMMVAGRGGGPGGFPGARPSPGGAPPIGGTPGFNPNAPSPYQTPTQFPPALGGPAGPPSAVNAPPTRGPFPPGFDPNAAQGGPPPAGPGGGRTPIPYTPPQPGAGDRNVPPGAGGMFGPGSTAPMNPEALTGVGTGGIPPKRPMPPGMGGGGPAPPNMGPGAGGQIQNAAANVQARTPMDAAGIAAINPSVFQEQQGLMNKQRAQANWLQGGAGIEDRGQHTRGKYGTYTGANPLTHATKAFARGKGMRDIKKLTQEEKDQIEELRGMRGKVGGQVLKSYGLEEAQKPGRERLPVGEYTFE